MGTSKSKMDDNWGYLWGNHHMGMGLLTFFTTRLFYDHPNLHQSLRLPSRSHGFDHERQDLRSEFHAHFNLIFPSLEIQQWEDNETSEILGRWKGDWGDGKRGSEIGGTFLRNWISMAWGNAGTLWVKVLHRGAPHLSLVALFVYRYVYMYI